MRPFEGSEGNNVLSLVKKGIYSYPDDVELSKEGKNLFNKVMYNITEAFKKSKDLLLYYKHYN